MKEYEQNGKPKSEAKEPEVDYLARYRTARAIHPEAKTLSIMEHRWTVVFHTKDDYVIVDRILPSSTMA